MGGTKASQPGGGKPEVNEKNNASDVEKEKANMAQPAANIANGHVEKEEKKVSEVKHPEECVDDDAAFALQLHKEEVDLVRACTADNNNNLREEAWEEVTNK